MRSLCLISLCSWTGAKQVHHLFLRWLADGRLAYFTSKLLGLPQLSIDTRHWLEEDFKKVMKVMKRDNTDTITQICKSLKRSEATGNFGDLSKASPQRMLGTTLIDWTNFQSASRWRQIKSLITWAVIIARTTHELDKSILKDNVSRSIFQELHGVLSARFARPTGYEFWTPGLNAAAAAATPFTGFTKPDAPSLQLDIGKMLRKQEKEIDGLVDAVFRVSCSVANPSEKAKKRMLTPDVMKALVKLMNVSVPP